MKTLTEKQLACVNDSFSNNQEASNEELVNYFINDCGLDNEQAMSAISFRTNFFTNPFAELNQAATNEPGKSIFLLQEVYAHLR